MTLYPPYPSERLSLPIGITSQRLNYRLLCAADWPGIWALDSDPEVMRYIRTPANNRQAHRQEFEQRFLAGELAGRLYALEWLGQPSELLGWVLLRPTEDHQWIEIGYRLHRQCWGQGIATEATATVVDIAFGHWQVDQVMAVTHPDNRASQRVLEKLGFTDRGLTDQFYDTRTQLFVRTH